MEKLPNFWKSIAISGEAGTGKSSLAKALRPWFNMPVYGAGEIFREWSALNNNSSLSAKPGQDEIHDDIDQEMIDKLLEGGYIVEGRLAGLLAVKHNIPGVMKVLLVCNFEERVRRIWERDRLGLPDLTKRDVEKQTQLREAGNRQVFGQRYGMDYLDESLYNHVVQTDRQSFGETVQLLAGLYGVTLGFE